MSNANSNLLHGRDGGGGGGAAKDSLSSDLRKVC